MLNDVTWADYQRFLEIRGDRSAPRISYAGGRLEIMSPSREHETLKSLIGRLVEIYCLETGVVFSTLGSWTLEHKELRVGVEPDECYLFGPARTATRPDLAIEVIWTSGSVGKLELYRQLAVREVWFWRRGAITPYVLRGETYVESAASDVLPGIDLVQLAGFLDGRPTSDAMQAYRSALRG